MASEGADKIRLELVAQRLATDAADSQVRDALVEGFMRRVWTLVDGTSGGNTSTDPPLNVEKVSPGVAAGQVFGAKTYGFLLKQMGIFDHAADEKVDQIAVLKMVEESCRGKDKGAQVLLFVAKEMVDGGVCQEEGVFEWWDAAEEEGGKEEKETRKLTEQYVDLLRDAEEDSSEEEEEESEEESDE
jgi:hypothetical protein